MTTKLCSMRRLATNLLVALLLSGLVAAPAFAETFKPFKLKTLEGKQTALADILGKTTLVAFFFPTCGYCNAAFPHVQKLYDTYKAQGLSVVWINVLPEQQKLIKEWRAKHGYDVPVLVGASLNRVQRDYDLVSTPTHYLLDAKGQVLSRQAGYEAGDEQRLEQQIRAALGLGQ